MFISRDFSLNKCYFGNERFFFHFYLRSLKKYTYQVKSSKFGIELYSDACVPNFSTLSLKKIFRKKLQISDTVGPWKCLLKESSFSGQEVPETMFLKIYDFRSKMSLKKFSNFRL